MTHLTIKDLSTKKIAIRFFSEEQHEHLLKLFKKDRTSLKFGICSNFYAPLGVGTSDSYNYSHEPYFDCEDFQHYFPFKTKEQSDSPVAISWYKRNKYTIYNYDEIVKELQLEETINQINVELE